MQLPATKVVALGGGLCRMARNLHASGLDTSLECLSALDISKRRLDIERPVQANVSWIVSWIMTVRMIFVNKHISYIE